MEEYKKSIRRIYPGAVVDMIPRIFSILENRQQIHTTLATLEVVLENLILPVITDEDDRLLKVLEVRFDDIATLVDEIMDDVGFN